MKISKHKTGVKIWSGRQILREEWQCPFCLCKYYEAAGAEPDECPVCGTIYAEIIDLEEE